MAHAAIPGREAEKFSADASGAQPLMQVAIRPGREVEVNLFASAASCWPAGGGVVGVPAKRRRQ
jgi:hypothetical protein